MTTEQNKIIFLSDVRLSFPHLIEPQRNVDAQTGKERISYNCELIMPNDHPGFAAFWKRYSELAIENAKDHAQQCMAMIQSDRKSRCYGQGEEKVNKKTFQPYDGYAGNVYITAGRDTPPQIIQADGTPIDPNNTMAYQQLTRKMYGGCRVNVAIKPWWQKPNPAKQYGHGIRCDLVAVQFLRDDVPFGEGAIDASGMFGTVAASSTTAPQASNMPAAPFAPAGLPSFLQGN